MSSNPHECDQVANLSSAKSGSVKECACVAGTCVLCVLAAPLLALVGLVVYALMLLGLTAGTAWGIASAVKGDSDGAKPDHHQPRLDSV